MNKIRKNLSRFPQWVFTIITVLLILWLTLAPDPLGDDAPSLFPGADKIVHSLMFGFLTVMVLLDRERQSGWKPLAPGFIAAAACLCAAFGIGIEFVQKAMEMGRGFEVADMIADTIGAAICGIMWWRCQHYWSLGSGK